MDFAGSAASFDVVLYSEFIDREALVVYQTHPEHEAVKSFIVEATEERAVVDYEDG
ncbi:Dabb family protein [Chlorobium limicola]|uniref:Dabb family protein n=1 Tax=Chlorobium limicola TaxID=1092 RepID=UPI00295285E3|nr:Dabb family protein [Chlorobium limicola]